MSRILCVVLSVYLVLLVVRAVMSWFPVRPGTPWSALAGVLHDLTEPVLAPVRRVIPPAGMFDISFLVVVFVAFVVRDLVC